MPRSRSVPLRLCALATGAALAVLPLVGCEPVRTGAAAVVGDDTISVDSLQELTTRVLDAAETAADPQAAQQLSSDTAALQRQALSRLIDSRVLAAAAEELDVTVTEGEVDRQLAQLQQEVGGESPLVQQAIASGIPPADLRSVVRDIALARALSQAVVADLDVTREQLRAAYEENIDNYDQVHAAHILVENEGLADRILRQARANPDSFARLARQHSTDTNSRANGGDLGVNGPSRFDEDFARAVFGAQVGSIVKVRTQFGWHVVRIIAHDVTPLADATPELRQSILQEQADTRLNDLLTRVAGELDISVNPRYGRWDTTQRAIVPVDPESDDALSKPVPTPAATAPGDPLAPVPQGSPDPPSG